MRVFVPTSFARDSRLNGVQTAHRQHFWRSTAQFDDYRGAFFAGTSLIDGRSHKPAILVSPKISATKSDELEKHVNTLAALRRTPEFKDELVAAGQYIENALQEIGGLHVEKQAFDDLGQQFHNVIATKPGQGPHRDEIVIVMAHFDAVDGSSGADDNASGVAGVIEAARKLAPLALDRTVMFVATNLEERGHGGARALLKSLGGRHVVGAINLEMIGYRDKQRGSQTIPQDLKDARQLLHEYATAQGYPELGQEMFEFLGRKPKNVRGDFLAAVANGDSMGVLSEFLGGARTAEKFVPIITAGRGEATPDLRRSDHKIFWDAGIAAIKLTDTANFRNPHYHHNSDTPDSVDMAFLRQNTAAIAAGAARVAGLL